MTNGCPWIIKEPSLDKSPRAFLIGVVPLSREGGRPRVSTNRRGAMGSIKGQKHNPYIMGRYAHINPNDIVFTPDWLAKYIVGMFEISGKVLEPCKGEGAFLKYLPPNTDWCEIVDGKNYYDYKKPNMVSR